jgi:hypothetical protein
MKVGWYEAPLGWYVVLESGGCVVMEGFTLDAVLR